MLRHAGIHAIRDLLIVEPERRFHLITVQLRQAAFQSVEEFLFIHVGILSV